MRMKENAYVKGNVYIKLLDINKKIKEEKEIKNLVVNTGINYITDRMIGNNPTVMSHMAVGSDQTLQEAEQELLLSEIGRVPLELDSDGLPAKDGIDKIVYQATFLPGEGTGGIREVGIFNSGNPNEGIMLCRTTFDVVNKGVDDTISINWTIFLFSDES